MKRDGGFCRSAGKKCLRLWLIASCWRGMVCVKAQFTPPARPDRRRCELGFNIQQFAADVC